MSRFGWYLGVLVAFGTALLARPVQAAPTLQLYVEGETYVGNSTDPWEVDSWVLPGVQQTLRIWAIAYPYTGTGDDERYTPISDVRISVAYISPVDPVFQFTPSTTLNYGGFYGPHNAAGCDALLERGGRQ